MPDVLKTPLRDTRQADRRPDSVQPETSARNVFSAASSNGEDAAVSREDEANMRRALGMLGGASRAAQPAGNPDRRASNYNSSAGHGGSGQAAPRRHRFVQDGDVPVTVVRRGEHASDLSRSIPASPVNRLDALQESLAGEQAARVAAERALEEAQATIRTLQTRLSHLELARDEAAALAQSRLEAANAAALFAEAQAAEAVAAEARVAAEPPVVNEPSDPDAPASWAMQDAPDAAATAATPRKPLRGRPPKPVQEEMELEPEPVKWWLSSRPAKAPVAKRARPAASST